MHGLDVDESCRTDSCEQSSRRVGRGEGTVDSRVRIEVDKVGDGGRDFNDERIVNNDDIIYFALFFLLFFLFCFVFTFL